MSRDIFVQDLPEGLVSVEDIPDDFEPKALKASRTEVIAAILAEAPHANFSDPAWGVIEAPGLYHIEVNLAETDQLDSFAFHLRGGVEAELLLSRILRRLNLYAIDTDSENGLFQFVPS